MKIATHIYDMLQREKFMTCPKGQKLFLRLLFFNRYSIIIRLFIFEITYRVGNHV